MIFIHYDDKFENYQSFNIIIQCVTFIHSVSPIVFLAFFFMNYNFFICLQKLLLTLEVQFNVYLEAIYL